MVGGRTGAKGSVLSKEPHLINGDPDLFFLFKTTAIYTLQSGRSPQNLGIIPDFHISDEGEFIENGTDYVSLADELFSNNIQFEGNQWKQNRPEERDQLLECINKEGRAMRALKEKALNDERYRRPFIADYPLELAKDILMCASLHPDILPRDYKGLPFRLEK